MKKNMKKTLIIGALITASMAVFAQPGGSSGGGSGSGGAPPPPGTGAPIDGGAVFLMAGIAAYAHKKLKSQQAISIYAIK
jgi:hypothetical protein